MPKKYGAHQQKGRQFDPSHRQGLTSIRESSEIQNRQIKYEPAAILKLYKVESRLQGQARS